MDEATEYHQEEGYRKKKRWKKKKILQANRTNRSKQDLLNPDVMVPSSEMQQIGPIFTQ